MVFTSSFTIWNETGGLKTASIREQKTRRPVSSLDKNRKYKFEQRTSGRGSVNGANERKGENGKIKELV